MFYLSNFDDIKKFLKPAGSPEWELLSLSELKAQMANDFLSSPKETYLDLSSSLILWSPILFVRLPTKDSPGSFRSMSVQSGELGKLKKKEKTIATDTGYCTSFSVILYTAVPLMWDELLKDRLVVLDLALLQNNNIFRRKLFTMWDYMPMRDNLLTAEDVVLQCRVHCFSHCHEKAFFLTIKSVMSIIVKYIFATIYR